MPLGAGRPRRRLALRDAEYPHREHRLVVAPVFCVEDDVAKAAAVIRVLERINPDGARIGVVGADRVLEAYVVEAAAAPERQAVEEGVGEQAVDQRGDVPAAGDEPAENRVGRGLKWSTWNSCGSNASAYSIITDSVTVWLP